MVNGYKWLVNNMMNIDLDGWLTMFTMVENG